MATRRRKRAIRKTRKKKGGELTWTPRHNRIVAIRSRAKNHSQKMVDHLQGLVEEFEKHYNKDAYNAFIKQQAEKWSEEGLHPLGRLAVINVIAHHRFKRKFIFQRIFKFRNQEVKNISNYMKIAALEPLSKNYTFTSISGNAQADHEKKNKVRIKEINDSIKQIEEKIDKWGHNEQKPPSDFKIPTDPYYRIIALPILEDVSLYDKKDGDRIRFIITEDQNPMAKEWIEGCNDLLLYFIKTDFPGIITKATPNPPNVNANSILQLYILLYYVLKNYANSLRLQTNDLIKRRGLVPFPSDFDQCDKMHIRSAKLYLDWRKYQYKHKICGDLQLQIAERKLEYVKERMCTSLV